MKNSEEYNKDINSLYSMNIELYQIILSNRIILENEENFNFSDIKEELRFLLNEYFLYFSENIENKYSEEMIEFFDSIISESHHLNEIEYL